MIKIPFDIRDDPIYVRESWTLLEKVQKQTKEVRKNLNKTMEHTLIYDDSLVFF